MVRILTNSADLVDPEINENHRLARQQLLLLAWRLDRLLEAIASDFVFP